MFLCPGHRAAHPRAPLAAGLIGLAALLGTAPAGAQFAAAPGPLLVDEPPTSQADSPRAYREDAARHLYQSYPMHVWRGKLPPVLHAVAITETTVDVSGRVSKLEVVREPAAAKEVTPWIRQMILRAQPYPVPSRLGEAVVYTEIWLVDRSGRFQLDTLTEGQLERRP